MNTDPGANSHGKPLEPHALDVVELVNGTSPGTTAVQALSGVARGGR